MSPSNRKQFHLIVLWLCSSMFIYAQDDFPDWGSRASFKQDLKRSSLLVNLPNLTDSDHFLGVQMSGGVISTSSGGLQLLPAARLSLFPNPDYNLWVQFGSWSGNETNFSVGTGIQIEFNGENARRRQAIGLSWNSAYAEDYSQRDIAVHGLLGYHWNGFNLGLIALYDFHHLIVTDGLGIPDYDESIWMGVPYITWMLNESFKTFVNIPINSTGPGIAVGCELLIRKRH